MQGDSLEKTVRMRVDIACLVCIVIQCLVYAKMVANMAGKDCSAHKVNLLWCHGLDDHDVSHTLLRV